MAKTLTGIGTDFTATGDVTDVYIKVVKQAGSSAPPYNFFVKYSTETLYSSTYGPTSWVKLSVPTGGWTVDKVKELTVMGDQYSTYSTTWADTNLLVIGNFASGNTTDFFAFFYP